MADTMEPPTNGHISDNDSLSGDSDMEGVARHENIILERQPKTILKNKTQAVPAVAAIKPELPEQPEFNTLNINELTPLSQPIIARQATINIGTIGEEPKTRILLQAIQKLTAGF